MKKSVITLIIILITTFSYSQVKIKGVVTYYFNESQGNKPDIGATVVVVDTSKVSNFDYSLWHEYHMGKEYRKIHEIGKKIYNNYNTLYEKYNSETDEKFDILDKKLFPRLFQFISGNDQFIETTVDGNGNYSVNVSPGVYYVFIKSKLT